MCKLIDERNMAKGKREQKRKLRCWRKEDEEYRCLDREVRTNCRHDKNGTKAGEVQEAVEKINAHTAPINAHTAPIKTRGKVGGALQGEALLCCSSGLTRN